MLLRYRLSLAIVFGALAGTMAVFTFARPQYHDPFPGQQFDLSSVERPVAAAGAAGWRWPHGTPGFRFGQDEEAWNDAKLRPADLSGARSAAVRAGVAPDSLRVLSAQRDRRGDVFAFVAGSDTRGKTCVGTVVPATPVLFSCALDRQVALVIAAPGTPEPTKKYGTLYPLHLLGVARGDVTRVSLDLPGLDHATLYSRHSALGGWWGTFGGDLEFPRAWHGRVTFFGAHGRLASAPISSRATAWLLEP